MVWTNILLQILVFIVGVYLIGYVISLVNRFFYRLVGNSRGVCYATGVIGTPIHELGHAVMCLVFFHKIVDIKLFQIGDEDGTLGYVAHTYNRRNIWCIIGNYFIGVAPIVCGTAVLFLLMNLLLPDAFSEFTGALSAFTDSVTGGFSWDLFGNMIEVFWNGAVAIFSAITVGWQWWVFFIVAMCISIHQNLSGADIKNSLTALPLIIVIITLLNVIFGFVFDSVYGGFVEGMNVGGGYLIGGLMFSLACSLLSLSVGLIVRLIRKLCGK